MRPVKVGFRSSVRTRLVLLFFAITAGAVGFVYLYVVPQLTSSLTAQRLERLEREGAAISDRLVLAARSGISQERLEGLLRRISASVEARVTLLGVRSSAPRFVVADSGSDAEATLGDYLSAQRAAESGQVGSGISSRGGLQFGETAVPIALGQGPVWIAVLSTPLDEVEDNVALIRRQIIIAGAIALTAALIAAWLAAGAHARRLRRLEEAAELVAGGNFRVPIPVGAPDEVGQLAETFGRMQARLARLDSARRDFIANASHELRTPIASLGGFVELLGEEEEPDPEARREFVTVMKGQIERLTKLSTDLLDLSKLDADALELSSDPVDLVAVATEVANEFMALAERAGSRVVLVGTEGRKPLARADLGRTMQILRILIDNAIKHTPGGTRITIQTTANPETTSVSVIDDGPGIDAGNQDRIFERFQTADSAGGSGLGLAIARELARLMGGELSLVGRRGYTSFTLTLPSAGEVAA